MVWLTVDLEEQLMKEVELLQELQRRLLITAARKVQNPRRLNSFHI